MMPGMVQLNKRTEGSSMDERYKGYIIKADWLGNTTITTMDGFVVAHALDTKAAKEMIDERRRE
jgi:hypothetical protein